MPKAGFAPDEGETTALESRTVPDNKTIDAR